MMKKVLWQIHPCRLMMLRHRFLLASPTKSRLTASLSGSIRIRPMGWWCWMNSWRIWVSITAVVPKLSRKTLAIDLWVLAKEGWPIWDRNTRCRMPEHSRCQVPVSLAWGEKTRAKALSTVMMISPAKKRLAFSETPSEGKIRVSWP